MTDLKIANIRAGTIVPPGGVEAVFMEYVRLGRPLTQDEVDAVFARIMEPTPDGAGE